MDKFVLSLKKDLQDSKICSVSSTVQKSFNIDYRCQITRRSIDNSSQLMQILLHIQGVLNA